MSLIGVSLSDILFIKSFGFIMNAALEVPIGFLSDRIRRKWILAASSFVYVAAQVIMLSVAGLPNRVAWLYVAECFVIVSSSLYSGTKSSILADDLKERDELHRFGVIQNSALSLMRIASSIFIWIGGVAYLIKPQLPFLLNIVILIVGGTIIMTFRETKSQPDGVLEPRLTLETQLADVKAGVRRIWVLVVVSSCGSAAFTFLGIVLQSYLQKGYGLRIESQVLYYQCYVFASMLGGFLIVPFLRSRRKMERVVLLYGVIALGFYMLARQPAWYTVLGVLLVMRAGYGAQNLFFLNEIHYFAKRTNRAMMHSLVSVGNCTLRALLLFTIGQFLKAGNIADIRVALFAVSLVTAIAIAPMLLLLRSFYIPQSSCTQKPENALV